MPHPSFGPTLDASGVLASRLLDQLRHVYSSGKREHGSTATHEPLVPPPLRVEHRTSESGPRLLGQ